MAFFKLLRSSPLSARIGLAVILINILAAILAPVISPYGETEIVGDVWLSASKDLFLGTDHLGRDLFSRLLYGARITIAIAFATVNPDFLFLGLPDDGDAVLRHILNVGRNIETVRPAEGRQRQARHNAH